MASSKSDEFYVNLLQQYYNVKEITLKNADAEKKKIDDEANIKFRNSELGYLS